MVDTILVADFDFPGLEIERVVLESLDIAAVGRYGIGVGAVTLEFVADDPYQSADEFAEYGVEKVSFDGLLERSDIVSVDTSLTEESILELRETVTRDVARVLGGEAPENPAARDASSG